MRGRVERFRDELQVEVRAIERAAERPTRRAFLPVAYRDLDELDGFLEHLAREVHDPRLPRGCSTRCSPTPRCAPSGGARRAPAAGTTPTSAGCSSTRSRSARSRSRRAQLHPRLNCDLLICAALVHDLGKTREFTYGAEIGLTEEGRLLGHLVLGQQLLERVPRGLDDARALALAALRALPPRAATRRPGRRFGSPEALALYRLNALDASVKGALEHGLT